VAVVVAAAVATAISRFPYMTSMPHARSLSATEPLCAQDLSVGGPLKPFFWLEWEPQHIDARPRRM
jgi:hypothetical protein